MTHEQASELLAVFALDAVEREEHELIEAHLATCPRCRAELDAHREVAAALGNSFEPLPEGLWSRIAGSLPERPDQEPPPMPTLPGRPGAVEREPGAVVPIAGAARPGRGRLVAVGSFAAAAAVAAIVLGVNVADDNSQISELHHAVGRGGPSAVRVALTTPGHTVVNVESAAHRPVAQFVLVPDGRGYLVRSHLPRLAAGQTYQLWGLVGGKPISLGLMGRTPEQVTFTLAGSRRPSALAVTAEPAGGSVVPTLPMVGSGPV
jgi:anti-sigma factor RsiW